MTDEIANLSFERALEELDGLIAKLEGGQIDLADAVEAYRRGTELAGHCGQLLDRTEATITQLVAGPGGAVEAPLTIASAAQPKPAAKAVLGVPHARSATSSDPPIDPDDVPF